MLVNDLSKGFEVYKTYLALKNHFTKPTYDYFKYNKRTKASRKTFESRNDKYFFQKLSKHKEYEKFLVANIVDGTYLWIGDLIGNEDSEKIFLEWKGRQESITYLFKKDLEKLKDNFDDNLLVEEGQYPYLLLLFLRKDITMETVVILNDLVSCFRYWSKSIEEDVIFPDLLHKFKKYKPFVSYDRDKMKKIVLEKFHRG